MAARAVAHRELAAISHSMALEDQALDDADQDDRLRRFIPDELDPRKVGWLAVTDLATCECKDFPLHSGRGVFAMPSIEKVATITAKGQTTIPKAVRQALGADYGGKIAYRIDEHGVSLHRVEAAEDPALGAFLEFLATDMRIHPERIQSISSDLRGRIEALTARLEIDLNAPIEGEVAL